MGPRLKLPAYVQQFLDRHGKPRFYFRRAGFKTVPLPGLPWSPTFMAAYESAVGAESPQQEEIGASRTVPGSVNALVVSYYKSADWNDLATETQNTRRRIIERFRAEHGEKRVALLQHNHIVKILGAISKPSAKRHWLKAIRGLLRSAIPTMRKDDPTRD